MVLSGTGTVIFWVELSGVLNETRMLIAAPVLIAQTGNTPNAY